MDKDELYKITKQIPNEDKFYYLMKQFAQLEDNQKVLLRALHSLDDNMSFDFKDRR